MFFMYLSCRLVRFYLSLSIFFYHLELLAVSWKQMELQLHTITMGAGQSIKMHCFHIKPWLTNKNAG